MKKRLLALVLAICTLSVMLCACSEENKKQSKEEPVSKELPQWAKIYTDFIIDNIDDAENINWFHGVYYIGVNDLNFDGTPELIFSDNVPSAACSIGIFYIEDNTVKHCCGESALATLAGTTDRLEDDGISYYTNFEDDWLTVRKNANTGEIRYVMYTWNGATCDNFGNIVSFGPGENGELEIVNEFEFYNCEMPTEEERDEEHFYVSGKSVTEEEYNEAVEEFEKTWIDTGVRTCAMADDYDEYSNKIPISLEREDLETLFRNYEKEY